MKFKIKNYKGNLVESLTRFQRRHRGQRITEARRVGRSLYITTEASKFDNMPNAMDELISLRDSLKADAEMIEENNERITKIENMIQRFTVEAIDRRKSAKFAKAQAAKAEKETNFLEEDCKAMAEIMGSHDEYFFAIEDKAGKTGIVLTKAIKVASQKDAYADLFKKLSDEKFIKENPALQDSAKNLIGLLEAARRTALKLGIISDEPEEPEVTWRANMYDMDDSGKMTKVNEGILDAIRGGWDKVLSAVRGTWNKVVEFFSNLFFPEYEEAEARYMDELQNHERYLDSVRGACEEFIAENA